MKSNDILNRDDIRALMQKAIENNDSQGYADAMDKMMQVIAEDLKAEYEEKLQQAKSDSDRAVLSQRGVRQLTSEEKLYYQKLSEAMKAPDPKQALTNANIILPETVLNAVFDELQTSHPLLSKISFTPTSGAIKMLMNTNGYQEAQWGALCSEIIKEILAGFKEVNTGLLKLTAFLPVCKDMIELGPDWLDNFVRQTLYEVLANGLEAGIVKGDGNEKPIGMNRQVGSGVSVMGGVYPEKTAVKVTDLDAKTVGNLLSLMAVDENGKFREVKDVIFVVNPQDYFQKVMPATTIMAPDGTYRNDVMPYPMTILQSPALDNGEAIMGIGYKYFAAAGTSKEGRIEYSDQYQFLEDNRVYMIKLHANGFPMDNNAFLKLDISELKEKTYKVETVTDAAPSNVATLAFLQIGNLELTPVFATGTDSYTASTTNDTNIIRAIPTDAGASIEIEVADTDGSDKQIVENGTAAKWYDGSNTVTITVTAEDGTTTDTYTATVTKS